jgi:selenide,water dikinase
MALGAEVTLVLETAALPLLPDAVALCAAGFTCGGTKSNAEHVASRVRWAPGLAEGVIGLVNDPQTSGGLLIAVPPARLAELREAATEAGAPCAAVVGEVRLRGADDPYVDFV